VTAVLKGESKMRVKGGTSIRRRHKKVLRATKGYRDGRRRLFRTANQAMLKAGRHQYRDRRRRKRDMRRLWIARINAAAREQGLSYSRFVHGLKTAGVEVDRKMLAEMAVHDSTAFAELATVARQAVGV
jgi:large subunit ribosomal protein L20